MTRLKSADIAVFCNVALSPAFLLLLICSGFTKASFSEEDLIADAGPLGKIKGVNKTLDIFPARPYIQFLGMRYAVAPTNTARFLPSEKYDGRLNASGEFLANEKGPLCIQPHSDLTPSNKQSEDCLYINVHTPKPYKGNDSELLPVIFFIHGGAFTAGSGDTYTGGRLLKHDVVFVSFNYRLGVLGFFSLNRENAPGNAGLYDMVNALKWTKDYIKFFGGNPNKITIAGQSAGSAAVTHLLASPLASGLFHGAIASSGTALAAWATTEDPFIDSLRIAELSNCYDTKLGLNPNETVINSIITCMQNADPQKLVASLFTFQVSERKEGRLGFSAVSPTIQNFATSKFPKILEQHPRAVFEAGKQANVPLLMGANRHDGSYVLGVYYLRYLKANDKVNDTDSDREFMSNEAVPKVLEALGIPNEFGVYDSIAKMYLGDARKSGNFWEMYPGFIDLFSVFFFKASSYQTALYHSQLNKQTFWYSFDYQGTNSLFDALFGFNPPPIKHGITHSDDLMYLFKLPLITLKGEDEAVSSRMMEYWANFATFGTPTTATSQPSWPALSIEHAKYLSIGRASSEEQYYDDKWSDVGWEVLPPKPTPPPTSDTTISTESLPTTSEESSETKPNTDSPQTTPDGASTGNIIKSINFYSYLVVLIFTVHVVKF